MPHWQPSFFSFVCELETDLMAPLPAPPPLSKLTKQVFFKSYEVLAAWSQIARCVEASLFGKPPKLQAS